MLSSPSQFNAFSCERHLFYNFLSLSFSIFLPLSPPFFSLHLFHHPSSHTLSPVKDTSFWKKEKKKNHMNTMNHPFLSVFFSLSTLLLPPFLFHKDIWALISPMPVRAGKNWATAGRLTKYKRMNKKLTPTTVHIPTHSVVDNLFDHLPRAFDINAVWTWGLCECLCVSVQVCSRVWPIYQLI